MELNINRTVAIGVASSVASLVVGSFAGYLVAKRKLERKYEDIAQMEIAEAKRKLKMFYKKDEFSLPQSLLRPQDRVEDAFEHHLPTFDEAVTSFVKQYDPAENFARDDHTSGTNGQPLAVDIPHTRNVFEENEMAKDYDDTEEQYPVIGERRPGRPYVITSRQHEEEDLGYQLVRLTYYADGALVEDNDRTEELGIVEDLIGEESLRYFGQDPDEPSIIFVRNDRSRTEYEVAYDERRFGEDILGLGPESDLVQKLQELQPRKTPNAGPRARFSNYNPGGVVRAAGE